MRPPVSVTTFRLAAAVLGGCLALAACNRAAPRPPVPQDNCVAARVGARPIYRDAVLRMRARQRLAQGPGDAVTPTGERAARQVALTQAIEQTLLLAAAESAHVTALADEIDAAYAQLTVAWPAPALDEALRGLELSVTDVKLQLRDALVASKVMRAQALDRVVVADADVDAYLAEHPEALQVPEQVRLRQIVVATDEQVAQVQQALKKRGDFAELAARLSQAPEALAGGDLGLVRRTDLPREMAEVCFALKPRQLSRPVRAADGLHLFWVSERLAARTRLAHEARAYAERTLRQQREEAAAATYLQQLQEKMHVQRFDDCLAERR